MVTVEELKKMDANKLADRIERIIGGKLPMEFRLKLAMLMGAGEAGIVTHKGDMLVGDQGVVHETITWQGIADWINQMESQAA